MKPPNLSAYQLLEAVGRLPRVSLGHLPTPFEELTRFSDRLQGPRIWIKRDDCTGLLFGGNKTRHNEFLLADALQQNADVVVWGAGIQSNNCRQTVAACNKLGLECHLYLTRAAHNEDIQGNLLLDHLMGATVHIVDVPLGPQLDDLLLERAEELCRAGRRPYVWDRVKGRPIAAVSYVLCMAEIQEAVSKLGFEPAAIYAAAAGATGAGLALGKAVLGMASQVRLLCPIIWPWETSADLAELANQAAELLGFPHRLTSEDIDVRTDFVGPAYGALTSAGREAIDLLARTEGILLDPVYTAKAMAGLIHDVRQNRWAASDRVVFLHTGGTPAVFAYRDELMETTAGS